MKSAEHKPTQRADTGAWGEAIAARHLMENGYTIRERNWRSGHGELDIVAERNGEIVFVEVRTSHSDAYGAPEETVRARKQATLVKTAQAYIEEKNLHEAQWRIDVIAIDLDARNHVTRLNHIECAVTL